MNKTKTLKIEDAAKRMNCKKEAAVSRLTALGYTVICSRCGGSGHYSYNQIHGTVCYGCGGRGKTLAPITEAILSEALARIEDGALIPYFAENAAKKQIKAARESVWKTYMSSTLAKTYSARGAWKAMEAAGLDAEAFLQTPVYRAQSFMNRVVDKAHDVEISKDLTAIDKVARLHEIESAVMQIDAMWIAFDKQEVV